MTLWDDALRRAQQLADVALFPTPPAPHPVGINPTLRVAADPQAGVREPLVRNGKADALGIITVTLDPVDPGTIMVIENIVVSTMNAAGTGPSANTTICLVYDTYLDPAHIFDSAGTNGNGAVAAYQPPRRLPAGRQLVAQWTGAVPNSDTGTMRVEYHLEQAGG